MSNYITPEFCEALKEQAGLDWLRIKERADMAFSTEIRWSKAGHAGSAMFDETQIAEEPDLIALFLRAIKANHALAGIKP